MLERAFQPRVIVRIKQLYPNAIILKNDANLFQGIPDLSIFYKDKWAMLETKTSSVYRPNQKYWLDILDDMSFARKITPSNIGEVINEIQKHFGI